ncbi:MAG: ABC transporter permease [Clostridiales bacterium]|nr:ABC transporter permease [Clostridiales bacterium]
MSTENWTTVIKPREKLFDLKLEETWKYRDLIALFVKRNFSTIYKQTILGPIWILITPLITTLIQTLVFGNIAGIGTNDVPPFLFYMCGTLIWSFFQSSLSGISNTFAANAYIFGKVYFPRLVMPITTVLSNLIQFSIRFAMFAVVWIYFIIKGNVRPNISLLLLPLYLLCSGIMAIGIGTMISSMTTKYKDLQMVVGVLIGYLVYLTPVIYPLSETQGKIRVLILCNPMTSVVEGFRYSFLSKGSFPPIGSLIYTMIFSAAIFCLGMIMFNKAERTFMDTV